MHVGCVYACARAPLEIDNALLLIAMNCIPRAYIARAPDTRKPAGYKQFQLVIMNRLNTPKWCALHR